MNIDLSPIDRRKVKNLGEVLEMNDEGAGINEQISYGMS